MIVNGLISFLLVMLISVTGWTNCNEFTSLYNEGRRYFAREQYLLSSIQFKLSSQFSCETKSKVEALFAYSLAMNKLGEKSEVLSTLEDLELLATPEPKLKINLFKRLELGISSPLSIDQQNRLKLWDERSLTPVNYKSPALAGAMSAVLPGLGQAYVGTWQSAAYSFLINALFLSATIELQKKGFYATSLTSGVVFSITYVGGIISAVQTAQIYNRNQVTPLELKLFEELFPELHP